jgi:4-hydroxy-tetrahydrodipicolinate synthase
MKNPKSVFRGVIPATLTAFREDGSIDLDGQRKFISWLVDNGIHGMMVCGTGGEFIAMTVEERKQVMEATVEANNGKVPILAQTGHYSTDITIDLSLHAKSLGVEALALITPYYLPRSEDEYYRHYTRIREKVDLPIVVYHNPAFAGPNFSPDLIYKMYKDDVIIGMKDSSGEIGRNVNSRLNCGDDFLLIHGLDIFPIESFFMGANAWVAGVANVLPKEFSSLSELAMSGEWEAARKEWYRLKPFVNYCITPKQGKATHQMQLYHSGVRMRGLPVGYTRWPGVPLEQRGEYGENLLAGLRELLAKLGYE